MSTTFCDHGRRIGQCPKCQRGAAESTPPITPLPNGHTFAGSTRDYDAAEVVHCLRCGDVVKDRHAPLTSQPCRAVDAVGALLRDHERAYQVAAGLSPSRLAEVALSFAPFVGPEDMLDARAEGLRVLLEQARAKGIRDERARVTRIRNKAFAGKAVDDDMLRMIVDFDRLLASGEDDAT